MRVYRVAHSDELFSGYPMGPYTVPERDIKHTMLLPMYSAHLSPTHPSPDYDETLGGIRPEEYCGFDSSASLLSWFEGFYRDLDWCGFMIYTYEVDPEYVRVGKRGQALIVLAMAKFISKERFPGT